MRCVLVGQMAKVEQRDCPKSLVDVYGAALRTAEKASFGHFAFLIAAKSMLAELFEPLLVQSLRSRGHGDRYGAA
jgi:hypothetical protein